MRSLLTKLAIRRQVGLAIGDRQVAMCRVAVTPLGPVEVGRSVVAIEDDQVGAALERLLKEGLTPRELARSSVLVGLPERRVFFSTRPIQSDNRDASPEVLLHEVLQSPTINIDDMAVDLVKAQPGKRSLASIVSCRKKYLGAVLSALEGCGVRPARVEPSPCALLRAGARRQRAPRKSKTLVRVFLGDGRGLAVLASGDLPLLWRSFELPAGGEAAAILSNIASVRILGQYCGTESDVDTVILHGRPDLATLPGAPQGPAIEGVRVVRCDGPGLDDGAAAFGLTLGLGPHDEAFNLAHSLGSSASIREIFPWVEATAHVAALLVATALLLARLQGHRALTAAVEAEDVRHAWAAKIPVEKLAKEKGDLEQRLAAVEKFLSTRIVWTSYARRLTGTVPPGVQINSMKGLNDLEASGGKGPKAKPRKSLVLQMGTPIAEGGAIPKEVEGVVNALRADELLARDFPDIDMTNIQTAEPPGRPPEARFTLICLPSADAPAKGDKDKAKGEKARGGKAKGEKAKVEKPRSGKAKSGAARPGPAGGGTPKASGGAGAKGLGGVKAAISKGGARRAKAPAKPAGG